MKSWKFKNGTEIHWAENGEPLEFKGSEYSLFFYHPDYGLTQLTSRSTLTTKAWQLWGKLKSIVRSCGK